MSTLLGFDYKLGRSVERSRRDWQRDMRTIAAAGGWRRCESGETFMHLPGGRIAFEIYSNVSLPAPCAEEQA